jgi:signal transduction histidine kinase
MTSPQVDDAFALESDEPIRAYALIRIELILVGLVASIPLDFQYDQRLALILGFVALPIALVIFFVAQRNPAAALNPAVALGDLTALALILALVPATWAAVHFCALILAMAYPLVRGETGGLLFALALVAVIIPVALLSDPPPPQARLYFHEVVFAVATVTGALFMGRVASSEFRARIRGREVTRRVIEAGYSARREVAQSLHDGPIQELVGVDMQINGAVNALARGDADRASELLVDARMGVERNIQALREELIALGPVAFDELTIDTALEQSAPTWGRRFGIDIRLELERLNMSNDVCGALFGIAQEAIANAGRHADADHVDVSLGRVNGSVVLSVRDDGRGFGDVSPLGFREPGHLGLASMRERAAIVGGELTIRSGAGGTEVRVRLPAAAANGDRP